MPTAIHVPENHATAAVGGDTAQSTDRVAIGTGGAYIHLPAQPPASNAAATSTDDAVSYAAVASTDDAADVGGTLMLSSPAQSRDGVVDQTDTDKGAASETLAEIVVRWGAAATLQEAEQWLHKKGVVQLKSASAARGGDVPVPPATDKAASDAEEEAKLEAKQDARGVPHQSPARTNSPPIKNLDLLIQERQKPRPLHLYSEKVAEIHARQELEGTSSEEASTSSDGNDSRFSFGADNDNNSSHEDTKQNPSSVASAVSSLDEEAANINASATSPVSDINEEPQICTICGTILLDTDEKMEVHFPKCQQDHLAYIPEIEGLPPADKFLWDMIRTGVGQLPHKHFIVVSKIERALAVVYTLTDKCPFVAREGNEYVLQKRSVLQYLMAMGVIKCYDLKRSELVDDSPFEPSNNNCRWNGSKFKKDSPLLPVKIEEAYHMGGAAHSFFVTRTSKDSFSIDKFVKFMKDNRCWTQNSKAAAAEVKPECSPSDSFNTTMVERDRKAFQLREQAREMSLGYISTQLSIGPSRVHRPVDQKQMPGQVESLKGVTVVLSSGTTWGITTKKDVDNLRKSEFYKQMVVSTTEPWGGRPEYAINSHPSNNQRAPRLLFLPPPCYGGMSSPPLATGCVIYGFLWEGGFKCNPQRCGRASSETCGQKGCTPGQLVTVYGEDCQLGPTGDKYVFGLWTIDHNGCIGCRIGSVAVLPGQTNYFANRTGTVLMAVPPPADKKARVDCRNIDIEKSLYGAGIVKFVDNPNVQVPNYLENKVTLPCAIQEAVIERWMKASKSYKYKFASSRKPKAAAGAKRKKCPKTADDKEGRKSNVLHFTEDNAVQAAMGKNDERILDSADEDKIGGTKVDL
jgi:hypothetical protein